MKYKNYLDLKGGTIVVPDFVSLPLIASEKRVVPIQFTVMHPMLYLTLEWIFSKSKSSFKVWIAKNGLPRTQVSYCFRREPECPRLEYLAEDLSLSPEINLPVLPWTSGLCPRNMKKIYQFYAEDYAAGEYDYRIKPNLKNYFRSLTWEEG